MKIFLFPVVIGGFIITFIFQGVMFANAGLQNQRLQKQLDELNQKLDRLQAVTDNEIIPKISQTKSIPSPTNPSDSSSSSLSSDPNDLLSPSNLAKTLGAETTTPQTPDRISLKPSWKTVDTYETAKASSKIIGKIELGKSYIIIDKKTDWYQIKLDSQVNAWVQAQFVYETI
jgi:hypothetical protein